MPPAAPVTSARAPRSSTMRGSLLGASAPARGLSVPAPLLLGWAGPVGAGAVRRDLVVRALHVGARLDDGCDRAHAVVLTHVHHPDPLGRATHLRDVAHRGSLHHPA